MFKLSRAELQNALEKVVVAIREDSTMPILSMVNVMARENAVYLTTTNTLIQVLCSMALSEKIEFYHKCFPCKMLLEMVKRSEGEEVIFEDKSNSICKVTCGSNYIDLQTMEPTSFPSMNVREESIISFSMPAAAFVKGIKKVISSVGMDETRPALSNIHIELVEDENLSDTGEKKQQIHFVAIDGFRMSLYKDIMQKPLDSKFSINVPTDASKILLSLFSKSEGDIKISVGKKYMTLRHENVSMFINLFEGAYLPYMNLMPSEFITSSVLNRKELLTGVEMAELLNSKTPLICEIEEDEFVIIRKNNHTSFVKRLSHTKEGNELRIGINPYYISTVLKNIEEQNVVINLGGAKAPCILHGEGNKQYINMLLLVALPEENA